MTIEEYKRMTGNRQTSLPHNPANRLRGKTNRDIGGEFESLISAACEAYRMEKAADIEKTPEPTKIIRPLGNGQYVSCFQAKAQPDYKGTLAGGRSVVFEAKHTASDRLLQSRVTQKQAQSLDSHLAMGAECFVLAGFSMRAFYRVPWEDWHNMKELFGRKYVVESDLAAYRLPVENNRLLFLEKGEEHGPDGLRL
jgi:recombination protein U